MLCHGFANTGVNIIPISHAIKLPSGLTITLKMDTVATKGVRADGTGSLLIGDPYDPAKPLT